MPRKQKIVGPISPEQVAELKAGSVPQEVFDAFNDLILEKINEGHASFTLKEVVARMTSKGLDEKDIFNKGWLNIEPAYRKKGWKVGFERPAPDETYDSYFTFDLPKKADS
ncbi:hypothetical protein M1116_03485 [Patescibacteria group bacterium]|nr:hypothetical protein [Patescibacteria group bacterium]